MKTIILMLISFCIITSTTNSAMVLVVEVDLTSFNLTLEGSSIAIEWVTASETNNHHFKVEHSKDGSTFTRTVAVVLGAGTTTETSSYRVVDICPELGTNWYRLSDAGGNIIIIHEVDW